jgi:hypothetical protein
MVKRAAHEGIKSDDNLVNDSIVVEALACNVISPEAKSLLCFES